MFLRAALKKDLLLHVLLRVSLESREFSKVCPLLKLVFFMVMGLSSLLLKFFLLIDLILGLLLHLFSEERFKVWLIVLELGRWMNFSRLSKPKGTVRDSRQTTRLRQTRKGQAHTLPGWDGSRRILAFAVARMFFLFK